MSRIGTGPKLAASRLLRGKNLGLDLLIGREGELAYLDLAWTGQGKKNVICIVGWGGVGKTSLVAHWTAQKLAEPNHSEIESYFDWCFYRQGTSRQGELSGASRAASADLFLKEGLEFFGELELAQSNAGAWPKGERLARLVGEHRGLLILDGLEPLQDARTGELQDEGLKALLRGLAVHNRGLCLVTTRQRLPELATWRQTTAPDWDLAQLSDEAGASVLTQLGVKGTDAEKRALSARVRGHALTLTLLGRYLKRAHHGDIRRADHVDFRKITEKEGRGYAFRAVAAYERWFEENDCAIELTVMRMLGLFDRPATPDCLAALRDPPIPGLTDTVASIVEDDWNEAINHLGELKLVEEQPCEPCYNLCYAATSGQAGATIAPSIELEARSITSTPGESGYTLDAHPLIREYFAKRLHDEKLESWQEGHRRLYEHLRDGTPRLPETLQGLLPLCHAVVHGCRAGRFQEALDEVFWARIRRGTYGYTWKKLGAFSADMMALSCFFATPWIEPARELSAEDQTFVMHEAGFVLQASGNLREALPPLRAALEMRVRAGDRLEAAKSAANLSGVLLGLGELGPAADCARQSMLLVEGGVDTYQWEAGRAMLAFIQNQAGDLAAAEALFLNSNDAGPSQPPDYPSISSLNWMYCDLLLGRQAYDEVERRSTKTLEWALEEGWLLQLAWAYFYLAEVQSRREQGEATATLKQSANYIENAVRAFRNSGYQDDLARGLLARAGLWARRGCLFEAETDIAEAEGIACRGDMLLHLADIHLNRARLFLDRQELKRARAIVEKCGYWRRKQELDAAEALSKNWP